MTGKGDRGGTRERGRGEGRRQTASLFGSCQSLWPLYSAPRRDGNQPSFCSRGGGRLLPDGESGGGGAGRWPRPRAPQTLRWFVVPAFLGTAWQPEGHLLLHQLRSLETHAFFFFVFSRGVGMVFPASPPPAVGPFDASTVFATAGWCPLRKGFSGWGPTVVRTEKPSTQAPGKYPGDAVSRRSLTRHFLPRPRRRSRGARAAESRPGNADAAGSLFPWRSAACRPPRVARASRHSKA